MSTEFDDEASLQELNRKFAHVQIDPEEGEQTSNFQRHYDLSDLVQFRDHLLRNENTREAVYGLRHYLTQDISVHRIQAVLDLNILSNLCGILMQDYSTDMQYEAAWIMTNLAFGTTEQTDVLITSGVVNALVFCFRKTGEFKIKSQTAWAIANIAIDAPNHREQLTINGFIYELAETLQMKVNSVVPHLRLNNNINDNHQGFYNDPDDDDDHDTVDDGYPSIHEASSSMTIIRLPRGRHYEDIKDLTWSLANMCRGGFKTMEHWRQYLAAFHAMGHVIYFDNENIWMEACWGLARILSNMYGVDHFFNALELAPNLSIRLVLMLRKKPENQILPVIQTICNFSTGPNSILLTFLNSGLLNALWWFCAPDMPFRLRRNAILTIANLAAGAPIVIERVVLNENILRTLTYHLRAPGLAYNNKEWVEADDVRTGSHSDEWKIIKEVLYVLINILTVGNDDCIRLLLENYTNINPSLVHLLFYPHLDPKIGMLIIDVLTLIARRTNRMIAQEQQQQQQQVYNPYTSEMIGEGVMVAMSQHYHTFMNQVFSDKINQLRIILQDGIQMEMSTTTGDLETNTRRIVQGAEDGDVRFIENAIHSMSL